MNTELDNQSVRQSFSHLVIPSVSQVCPSVRQSLNQSVMSVRPSVCQSISQLVSPLERLFSNFLLSMNQVKERIRQEQDEERQRLESEMQRLVALEEEHRRKVMAKELEMSRIKDDLERKWERERRQVFHLTELSASLFRQL